MRRSGCVLVKGRASPHVVFVDVVNFLAQFVAGGRYTIERFIGLIGGCANALQPGFELGTPPRSATVCRMMGELDIDSSIAGKRYVWSSTKPGGFGLASSTTYARGATGVCVTSNGLRNFCTVVALLWLERLSFFGVLLGVYHRNVHSPYDWSFERPSSASVGAESFTGRLVPPVTLILSRLYFCPSPDRALQFAFRPGYESPRTFSRFPV